MEMQLSMVVLEVRDVTRSVEFYRTLGLAMPDPRTDRPVSILRMSSGVSLVLTEDFASTNDPTWSRPTGGYQQLMEFFAGEDAEVDAMWEKLTAAGYEGRMAPTQTQGPYAAMVDDPDGNVVLLTSDEPARISNKDNA
ncbi:VOC family protein [Flexivirga alba]|uniref:VOC family protein n=1 Tax=Flexivirga alba TaxID=702742 RepID=A0ABW2ABA0_9MICO